MVLNPKNGGISQRKAFGATLKTSKAQWVNEDNDVKRGIANVRIFLSTAVRRENLF